MSSALTEVAHQFHNKLVVLAPPYRASKPLHSLHATDALSLGSVVVGRGDTTIAVLAELTATVYRWPWIVPCLAMTAKDESLQPLVMLVTELRDKLVVLKQGGGPRDEVSFVMAAVRKRASPTARVLAQWIARRLRRAELEDPLCTQFRQVTEGIPAISRASTATFSRLFARHGSYTARDWRVLAHLCMYVTAAATPGDDSQPSLSLRNARHAAKKYLAVSHQVLTERLGWEWVLEAALRTGGYL